MMRHFKSVLGDSSKVISLREALAKRKGTARHSVFYIHPSTEVLNPPIQHRDIDWVDICDLEELRWFIRKSCPDVVFVEAQLGWANPLDVIRLFHLDLGAPVVLICPAPPIEMDPQFIKQAYVAGISDSLFQPVTPAEMLQSARVLLHLNAAHK